MMLRYLALAGSALLLAGTAQAQTTVYKGLDRNTSGSLALPSNPNSDAASAQFQAALAGTSTESFESFTTGQSAPLVLNFAGSAGTLTATLTGSGSVQSNPRSAPTGSGQYATDGNKYYSVTSGAFSIGFGTPVAAFGFYAVDIESDVQLLFNYLDGTSETFGFNTLFPGSGYNNASIQSGSVNFLGFINTTNPFTSVVFGQGPNSGGDILPFDRMTIGDAKQVVNPPSAVPEPSTWAMMLVGFGMIGGAMRRRQSARASVRFA